MRKHNPIRPNNAFIRELKLELNERFVTYRSARQILHAYGAERRGGTIVPDIVAELEKCGLYVNSFGNADSNIDKVCVAVKRLTHHIMNIDTIYGPASKLIRQLSLSDILLSLEPTRPVSSTSSIKEVAYRFDGELLDYLPVVEVSPRRFVGAVSRRAILKGLQADQGRLPIVESPLVRIHVKFGELLDAIEGQTVVSVELSNGCFYMVQPHDLGWPLARIARERLAF